MSMVSVFGCQVLGKSFIGHRLEAGRLGGRKAEGLQII
jgi:hypothetical protein